MTEKAINIKGVSRGFNNLIKRNRRHTFSVDGDLLL